MCKVPLSDLTTGGDWCSDYWVMGALIMDTQLLVIFMAHFFQPSLSQIHLAEKFRHLLLK